MPFLGGGLRGPKGDTGDPGANGTNALTAQDLTPLNSLIWRNPDADVVRERINNDNSKAFTNFGALPDAFLPTLTDLEFYRDFAGEKTLNHAAGPNIDFTRASGGTYFTSTGVLVGIDFSTTSNTVGTGSKTFTLTATAGADRSWAVGALVRATDQAASANFMQGTVTSYDAATQVIVIDVTTTGGSGTKTDWRIGFAGARFDHSGGSSLGLLIEESRTNLVLHSRGLNDAAWAKTDITAAQDQAGLDGAANSASSITATDANGTCLQAITSASAARATSAYVKRITGTGVIEMTQNGGTTWTAVTVTADWTRVTIPSATVTNPSVGFRIVTSGDAIAVDGVQCENGAFSTSVILTTTASVTRAADSAFVTPISSFYNQAEGTLFVEAIANNIPLSGQFPRPMMIGNATNNNNRIDFYTYLEGAALGVGSDVVAASNSQYGVFGAASAVGSAFKASTAVATNDFRTAVNGSLFGSADTSGILPDVSTMTHLFVGRASTGIPAGTSLYIRKVAYWPKRLTNTLLEQLTT
jgi:hypothetical protein